MLCVIKSPSVSLILSTNLNKFSFKNQINCLVTTKTLYLSPHKAQNIFLITGNKHDKSLILTNPNNSKISNQLIRFNPIFTSNMCTRANSNSHSDDKKEEKKGKKPSKFKMFYRQYGPSFLVIHLATVVAWIYLFFLISKQGYDITQILNLFEKMNIMSSERVKSIHERIENFKPETLKGYVTGNDIKHFVTAYMVYKVIAPFRYMVSIALTRAFVHKMRSKGIFKS